MKGHLKNKHPDQLKYLSMTEVKFFSNDEYNWPSPVADSHAVLDYIKYEQLNSLKYQFSSSLLTSPVDTRLHTEVSRYNRMKEN